MNSSIRGILKNLEIINSINSIIDNEDKYAITLNSIIDDFLILCDYIKERSEEYILLESKISDLLVSMIDLFNRREFEVLTHTSKSLIGNVQEWVIIVRNLIIISIVVVGVNYFTSRVAQILRSNNYRIVAFVDPTKAFKGKHIEGYEVISEDELQNYEFDFLLIMKDEELSALIKSKYQSKCIDYYSYAMRYMAKYYELFRTRYLHTMLYAQLEESKSNEDLEVIVTGLSYAQRGIDENYFSRKTVKLCSSSQDLYFDYQLLKETLSTEKKFKHCILGLSYYSFNYDLSLSKSQEALVREVYYPLLLDSHHLEIENTNFIPKGLESINELIPAPKFFTNKSLLKAFIKHYSDDEIARLNDKFWNDPTEDIPLEWLAKKRAESHSKLDYLETRRENVEIFNSILFLLKTNNIKPIVVIYPTQKIYSSYFSEKRIVEFYEILNEVRSKYDFQLIDMFSSSYFKEEDFSDGDHLNKIGARKMTLYLERNISW